MEAEKKFSKQDYIDWTNFRNNKKNTLVNEEFEMLCQFHAVYFNHKYYKPCTCNPKEINRWIAQLNEIYENGYK